MNEKKTDRISVRLPLAKVEEVKNSAEELGMSTSAFGGMVLWMGYKLWQRQTNPESVFTPDQWAKIGEAMGNLEKEG